ncbi:hypothetical protein B0J13DRAFT_524955 [Dactylonectria estremocensis]|uniref:Uncharacterized protein n=1 Tax=Dactylonectria estremocensis TaxID=1079267 RepID=A0A9P9EVQ1_9HYPO|nr:hypothetical protein B0J13DRAFT_524955 [Dactylonectria estremocensis]
MRMAGRNWPWRIMTSYLLTPPGRLEKDKALAAACVEIPGTVADKSDKKMLKHCGSGAVWDMALSHVPQRTAAGIIFKSDDGDYSTRIAVMKDMLAFIGAVAVVTSYFSIPTSHDDDNDDDWYNALAQASSFILLLTRVFPGYNRGNWISLSSWSRSWSRDFFWPFTELFTSACTLMVASSCATCGFSGSMTVACCATEPQIVVTAGFIPVKRIMQGERNNCPMYCNPSTLHAAAGIVLLSSAHIRPGVALQPCSWVSGTVCSLGVEIVESLLKSQRYGVNIVG